MRFAEYRAIAGSLEGFIQQVAVAYIAHGYWFYVSGEIPEGKDPSSIDEKLIHKYRIGISKWARARRKRAGVGNVHYIRYGRFFVLLATRGADEFFEGEPRFRDVRENPIGFEGYSVSLKRGVDRQWHPSVRIHPERYRELKRYFLELATHRTAAAIGSELRNLPYEPYAPVRRQLLNILRAVNRARQEAGLEPLTPSALRLRRRPVKPFDEAVFKEAA